MNKRRIPVMKLVRNSNILTMAVAAFCIMALLVVSASAAGTPAPRGTTPAGPGGAQEKYTMDQTLSDRGQEATIAFDALAFITGDACSDTFLPPGKVADYAGFQYLRDNDPTQMGHNTDFVTRISDNVLFILNEDQLRQFTGLSEYETPLTTQYGYMRYPLMEAFRANLEGNIPSGSTGLDKAAVMAYSAELYNVDASISIARAKTYASVIRSLNESQRAYLDRMKSLGMADMPVVDSSAALKNSGQGNSVAMRTYASEMFAWYAGSVESDVYFCPERQATYFGSFYLKDAPAMGNPGYSISTTLTGDSGQAFLDLLSASQRQKITGLVDLQRADLAEIVAKRTAIATELRTALAGDTIDESLVRSLSARYGELDGEISYFYATSFADVGKTLTTEQRQKMMVLRNLDTYTCEGAYLYSQPITMPEETPSDFLFGVGSYNKATISAWIQGLQQPTAIGTQPSPKPTPGPGNVTQKPPKPIPLTPNATLTPQTPRMPAGEIIKQLEQQGYNVATVNALLVSGNNAAVKEWLDSFRKTHPGVIEAIERSWMAGQTGRTSSPSPTPSLKPPVSPVKPVRNGIINFLSRWFV
jgi:Spy/CpxP family protein refolding chaperone